MVSRVCGLSSKKPGLQHHLFGVETEAFIGAGVVVVAADRIRVVPAQAKLEIVSRHALMDQDGPRIVCLGKFKEAQVRSRHVNVAGSILIEARRSGEVVVFPHILEGFEVSRQQQVAVVLHPRRHAENFLFDEEGADLLFIDLFGLYLCRLHWERRARAERRQGGPAGRLQTRPLGSTPAGSSPVTARVCKGSSATLRRKKM